MAMKPFVVEYTVTYRSSILIYAKDAASAEQYAAELYEDEDVDPERNGYDGCDIVASPASEEDVESMGRHVYNAE